RIRTSHRVKGVCKRALDGPPSARACPFGPKSFVVSQRLEQPAVTKEYPMPRYLLSVHTVDGEAREPMTDEQMQRSWREIQALEAEMKSSGAWVFSAHLHDADTADDAVQEAFALALRKWPVDGLPPNPGGWITTTARNRAIDHLRREARGRELLAQRLIERADDASGEEVGAVQDDRLRLMFTCCHPAL